MNPKNIFTELKRRNVYRAAVAYGVVAWFLTQLTTQVFPFFEIPNSAVRFVVIALAVGFPIAMLLAWVYEFTPEGVVRTEDLHPGQARSAQRVTGRIFDFIIIGALLLVIAMLIVGQRPFYRQTGESISQKSIAVLPFENRSEEKSNAYFADGIQDEILTRLSKIADLKVISRTSTQEYQGKPRNLREIAKQLGVTIILEGSVQKAADEVRVNVQLVNAQTDSHLWADTYDRKLTNIFGVESEIAKRIAESLQAKLTGREEQALAEKPTNNPEAYDAYLHAVAIDDAQTLDTTKRAVDLYAEAVRLDPQFALAWARLAVARSQLYFNGTDLETNSGAAVKDAADRAMSLQPELGEAWLAQGVYRYRVLRDFQGALQSYEEALRRLPNSAFVLQQMAHLERRLGQADVAQKHYQAAAQLDPRNIGILLTLADAFQGVRRFDEARAVLDRVLEMAPGNEAALGVKALTFQEEGRLNEAAEILAKAPANSQDGGPNLRESVPVLRREAFRRSDCLHSAEHAPGICQRSAHPDAAGLLPEICRS